MSRFVTFNTCIFVYVENIKDEFNLDVSLILSECSSTNEYDHCLLHTYTLVSVMYGFSLHRYVFLAHLSKMLIGELIGYPWSGVCRGRRRRCLQQSETSSPMKSLNQSKPNCMWSLLGKRGTKVYTGHHPSIW